MTEKRELRGWKEIADYLGVSVETARKYEKEHGLPVQRRVGKVFITIEAIERWDRSRDEPPPKPTEPGSTLRQPPRYRLWLTVGAIGVILILAISLSIEERSPVKVAFEGETLTALDKKSRTLWEVHVPVHESRYEKLTLVEDINHDDHNEVCVSYWPKQGQPQGGLLSCFDSQGKHLWNYPYNRELTVKDRRFEPFYEGGHLEWVADEYILLLLRQVPWYPSPVILLDPKTGKPASEYIHPGSISITKHHDVNGDGKKEILLGGINNPGPGFGVPILAILEIPFQEPKEKGNFFGEWNQREYAYLVFPRIDIFQAQEIGAAVRGIRILEDGYEVIVGNPPNVYLYYTLDPELKVQEIRPSDALIKTHNELHREGHLDHPYNAEELEKWKKILLLATAPDGNSEEIYSLLNITTSNQASTE